MLDKEAPRMWQKQSFAKDPPISGKQDEDSFQFFGGLSDPHIKPYLNPSEAWTAQGFAPSNLVPKRFSWLRGISNVQNIQSTVPSNAEHGNLQRLQVV